MSDEFCGFVSLCPFYLPTNKVGHLFIHD
jgi:hypothetical protein